MINIHLEGFPNYYQVAVSVFQFDFFKIIFNSGLILLLDDISKRKELSPGNTTSHKLSLGGGTVLFTTFKHYSSP